MMYDMMTPWMGGGMVLGTLLFLLLVGFAAYLGARAANRRPGE